MTTSYYIVEHPFRGVFIGKVGSTLKCSYSILRTDKKVVKFSKLEEAKAIRDKIKGSYVMFVHRGVKLTITKVE
jgi:hypothetical protein